MVNDAAKVVFILGTDHRYQQRAKEFSNAHHEAFARFVTEACHINNIKGIAEENSTEAIAENHIEESTLQTIARDLGIPHLNCDPDKAMRTKLGIRQENDIRVTAHFNRWPETIIQEKLQDSHRTRELYWYQRILEFDVWPVLFVCGADHSASFLSLLMEKNIHSELVAADWSA